MVAQRGVSGRLLVVEDDLEIADAMVDLLQFEGYEVSHARDGREALNARVA